MDLVEITVIEVRPPGWVLVEYEEEHPEGPPGRKYIQRKQIPWTMFPVSVRGTNRISPDLLAMGMEYSNVDLVSVLGEELPPIRVRDLEDALRREGLWMRTDYRKRSDIVASVIQRLRGADVTTVTNAATSGPKET